MLLSKREQEIIGHATGNDRSPAVKRNYLIVSDGLDLEVCWSLVERGHMTAGEPLPWCGGDARFVVTPQGFDAYMSQMRGRKPKFSA